MNKQCAVYCIDLIRAVMQEKTVPPMPENLSLEELYAFAKLHGVESMVYHGLEQLSVEATNPVWQDWTNRTDMLLTQSIVQLAERDQLFAALPAAGIPILPVKGCWLKEQYPDIDYRQMSDIDILIHEDAASRASARMLQWGYTTEDDLVDNHDSFIKPPYIGVELHQSLLSAEDRNYRYYASVWERAVPDSSYPGVFRLKPEDEYIYYFVHLYKHILHAGTGIRSILDSTVYRKVYPDMDRDYVQQELTVLGLASFAECIETMADCWFNTGDPLPETIKDMEISILTAGTYGTVNRRVYNEMMLIRDHFSSPLGVKIAYLFHSLFLPLKAMQELYPVLVKMPVLLPVFWVWRPISRLLFRPKALTNLIRQTNEEGDKLWSEYNWQEFQSK